jgi:4-methylaminobutanoate oxidase (formaldehyde-forming)
MAGLGWAVKLTKETPFLGREALLEQRARPLPRLLAGFLADPEIVLLGRETIYRDGSRVGWLSSGGYGYTLGKSIGYGYVRDPAGVDRDRVLAGRYELEVAGERVQAEVFLDPPYDPTGARIKI